MRVVEAARRRGRERLVHGGALVAEGAGHEARGGLDDAERRELAAGEDKIAERDELERKRVEHTFVEPFVASAEDERPLGARERVRGGLLEAGPGRAGDEPPVSAEARFHPFDGFDDRLGLQHHAGAAAERPIVDRAVPVAGEIAEIDDAGLDEAARPGDAEHADLEVGLDGLGKEGQDGKERHTEGPERPSRLEPASFTVKVGPTSALRSSTAAWRAHAASFRPPARARPRSIRRTQVFTGLVEACVPVRAVETRGTGLCLTLERPRTPPGAPPFAPEDGASISVSGCCLTLVPGGPPASLTFDLSAETLARTWFRALAPGRRVNLERALCLGDRLDGHMVSGHVDAVGTLIDLHDTGDGGWRGTFEVPPGFEKWLVDKGSVTVDGISLTVVEPVGRRFDVAVIPHTLAMTHLGSATVGQQVNLEADLVGKWIERLLPRP
jgi:riboflavin synthase